MGWWWNQPSASVPSDHFIGMPAREQQEWRSPRWVTLQRAGFGNPNISDAETGGSWIWAVVSPNLGYSVRLSQKQNQMKQNKEKRSGYTGHWQCLSSMDKSPWVTLQHHWKHVLITPQGIFTLKSVKTANLNTTPPPPPRSHNIPLVDLGFTI